MLLSCAIWRRDRCSATRHGSGHGPGSILFYGRLART